MLHRIHIIPIQEVVFRPAERYRDGNKADDTFPLLHVKLTTLAFSVGKILADVANLCGGG